jgi:F-type H+-transporting ATPase subunit gamma
VAGGQERILRRRIRTVQSTKKITRAMELIAASRIVRAQAKVHAATPYSDKLTAVIANLAAGGAGGDNKLLRAPDDVRRVAYVVVTADRGLAGGYNNNVLRMAERAIKAEMVSGREYELVLVGKKAVGYFRFRGYRIAASFQGFSDSPSYADAKAVADAALELFSGDDVQQVRLVYTQFRSLANQVPVTVPFLPLEREEPEGEAATEQAGAYEFEPGPDEILDSILPRYAEARLYAALLESAASEHAARQRAMKAATDNAEDLITNLTRVMNRARQDAITTEIMEIVGGAEALKQSGGRETMDLLEDRIEGRDPDLFRVR